MIVTVKPHFERKRAPEAQAKTQFTLKLEKYPGFQFDLMFELKPKFTRPSGPQTFMEQPKGDYMTLKL